MSRQRIFEIAVVCVLLGMGCFVVMGFSTEKRSCTEDQIEYCVEQVRENMAGCEQEGCRDLFNWFEDSCMIQGIQCDSEKVESVMTEMGWPID